MNDTVHMLTGGNITLILQKKIISTLKNQDDIDAVIDDYTAWADGGMNAIVCRVSGIQTEYYLLESVYHGGRVIPAVLISEVPVAIPQGIISFMSMLATLIIKSEEEHPVDGLTLLPCADSILYDLRHSESESATLCMIRFPSIPNMERGSGWLSADTYIKNVAERLRTYGDAYCVTRDTYAVLYHEGIATGYDKAVAVYKGIREPCVIVVADITNPKNWDSIHYMVENIKEMSGISILRTGSGHKKEEFDLLDMLGVTTQSYEFQQMEIDSEGNWDNGDEGGENEKEYFI